MNDAPLMLSVSGMRGLIGRSLTPDIAARFAAAIGGFVGGQSRAALGGEDNGRPRMVVGRDSRTSGEMIEMAAISGLLAVGCDVTRVGVLSTPGVGLMVEQLDCDGGIVITASHNPIIWNGIKPLVRHRGRVQAPTREIAGELIARFESNRIGYKPVEEIGSIASDDSAAQRHVDAVVRQVDAEKIRSRRFKVVVDGVCGAAGDETARLMDALGVELIHLHAEPTGLFPHTPEPVREHLTELCETVKQRGADIGFAQDPDADRLAIVDETGDYIGEEYTLALACRHALAHAQGGTTSSVHRIVANLSTSRMIDDVASSFGAQVIRTPVGEANVASMMQQQDALIGGEGNGGVILPGVTHVRDSLVGMAMMLEMLSESDAPLSAHLKEIPAYAIVKQKVDADSSLIEKMEAVLCKRFAEQRIDTQDGVRIDWSDRWVHVRPSNTEPIIRFIAESKNENDAIELIDEVKHALAQ